MSIDIKIKEWPDNTKLYEQFKIMNLFHLNLILYSIIYVSMHNVGYLTDDS